MITLLHGDNIVASREELHRIKANAGEGEIRNLDGRSLDTTLLTQALESGSIFSDKTLVAIENLFVNLGKKQKTINEFSSIIIRSANSCDVVFWEDREVSATVVKSLGHSAKIQLYKIPIIIFQFLDSLKPQNSYHLLSLFKQTISIDVPERIFVMVIRRLRQLIMLKGNVTPEGLQPWQVSRLTSQSMSFTIDKLLDMYTRLLDIEYSVKSGSSPFSLSQQLELLFVDL